MRTLKIAHIIGSGHAGLSIMQAVARTERAALVVVEPQQQVRELRELKRIELAIHPQAELPQPTLITKQQWWKQFKRKRRKK